MSESASIPATPATTRTPNSGARPELHVRVARAAIPTAPTTPPAVPRTVIPPELPRGTRAQVVMTRGGKGENAPISVAHVSAVAAASAPAAALQDPNRAA